jgi:hypothetical protein
MIAMEESFKYIQKELTEIKESLRNLVTQREIQDIKAKLVEHEADIKTLGLRHEADVRELLVKVASLAGGVSIVVSIVLSFVEK